MVTSESMLDIRPRPLTSLAMLSFALVLATCGGGDGTSPPQQNDDVPPEDAFCSIPEAEIVSGGVGRDGIPALRNPLFVPVDHAEAGYLRDYDRVIGIEIDGELLAIPHNILWWHEIVNLDDYGIPLAVSYCPLTGSSMVFDRTVVNGNDFGVSGLLYNNNLIMFNRRGDGGQESFFPQMMRGARCGPLDGSPLPMYPSVEMRWMRGGSYIPSPAWCRVYRTTAGTTDPTRTATMRPSTTPRRSFRTMNSIAAVRRKSPLCQLT